MEIVKKLEKLPLRTVALCQALGLVGYIFGVGTIIWRGEAWFGKAPVFLGPILFLTLFVTSAMICGFLALAYPGYLWLEKKDFKGALRLAALTTGWMMVCLLVILGMIIAF